jgi:hypothetical protein
LSFLATPALADVQITISYTSHEDRVAPRKGEILVDRKYVFTVTKDHKVKIGQSFDKGVANLNLGSAFEGKSASGLSIVGRARIEDNGVIYAIFFESFKLLIRAKIVGKNSCIAQVDYILLPGHEYFEARNVSTGVPITDTKWTGENVTCEIADAP